MAFNAASAASLNFCLSSIETLIESGLKFNS